MAEEQDGPAAANDVDSSHELSQVLGNNLRRLRTKQGHSLERLAKLSGVSRAMLSLIESGKSAPTINLLWRISTALDVPFATLLGNQNANGTVVLRACNAKVLNSSSGGFSTRALFPFDGERKVEFYELRLAAGHVERAEAHAPGTVENIVVTKGALEVRLGRDAPTELGEGDAILFEADAAHSYRNLSSGETVAYLVMTYIESVG